MKKIFRLVHQQAKELCLEWIRETQVDSEHPKIVEIREEGRNLEQNACLWKLLECFSEQVEWAVNGRMMHLSADDWKDILSSAFRKETSRIAPGLDGGIVMLGARTSKMGKAEFSEFLDFIQAVGAERGVDFDHENSGGV